MKPCLTADEVAQLMRHLEGAGVPVMSPPRHRALGYKLAMATGLRANELRSLTRESFDLVAQPAKLTCAAATITLPDWLAVELRSWFDAGGGCWESFVGRTLEQDLEAAGVTPTPGSSVEPLRHWYCVHVAQHPDMDLATFLRLTRHSTPEVPA